MTVNRFMVIENSGNISFVKVQKTAIGIETTTIHEYDVKTQTELDFSQEAAKRFANDYPDWDGVMYWRMICRDDLEDELNIF